MRKRNLVLALLGVAVLIGLYVQLAQVRAQPGAQITAAQRARMLNVNVATGTVGGEFYVNVEGSRQGKFKGESSRRGEESAFAGLRFAYEVKSPRDAASGQASGKRQHGPIVVTKEWGAASPQLFAALTTNEVLKSVKIDFMESGAGGGGGAEGKEVVAYTITLSNAAVSDIKQSVNQDPALGKTPVEEVSFTFQRIEVSNLLGKTTAMDDLAQ
jgi:type VI secretion system secreted protein Hcp